MAASGGRLSTMDWTPQTPDEALLWLAALLEGEGSFSATQEGHVTVRLGMTDRDVVELAAKLFNRPALVQPRKSSNHKTQWRVGLGGKEAIDLMKSIRPYMGDRRKAQIDHCIDSWVGTRRTLDWETASEIRKRADAGESVTALAKEFGVNRKVVEHIRERRTYKQPRGWNVEDYL